MPTTIASIDGVSKRFIIRKDKSVKERLVNFRAGARHRDDFWALRDVTADLELGATVGLVGHNGSGKSTLLKVIGGIIHPTAGEVRRRGRLAALLELGAGFHPDLTGRDNVYLNASILGMSKAETRKAFDEILDFSGIEDFIDTQVKFYSSGMYVRLAFSVAVNVDPDLLLVDEVLAVGDEPFQRKCLDKIGQFQREGRAIVLVSHAAPQIRELCDRVILLDHGAVTHDGGTESGLAALRASFETSRQTTGPTAAAVEGAPVSLLGVRTGLIEGDGVYPDLRVSLDVQVDDPRSAWGAGFTIVNSSGMTVYEFNSFGLAARMPRTAGPHTVIATVPGLNLGQGEYSVDVGLGLVDGTSVGGGKDTATFVVDSDTHGRGLVRFAPVIETVAPPAPPPRRRAASRDGKPATSRRGTTG